MMDPDLAGRLAGIEGAVTALTDRVNDRFSAFDHRLSSEVGSQAAHSDTLAELLKIQIEHTNTGVARLERAQSEERRLAAHEVSQARVGLEAQLLKLERAVLDALAEARLDRETLHRRIDTVNERVDALEIEQARQRGVTKTLAVVGGLVAGVVSPVATALVIAGITG